jgi:AraC family transcriptional regulator
MNGRANFSDSSASNMQAVDMPMTATLEKSYSTGPVTGTSGTVVKQREIPGFSLSETVYPEGLSLAPHRHSQAYLSFVLAGSYKEIYGDRECACSAGALRFLPPDELHGDEFESTVRCLLVRIDPVALQRLGDHAPVLSSPGEVSGLASSWLANRMYREFLAGDDIAPLAMEGVLLEILAESARAIGENGAHAPIWLRRVREALEESYLLAPSLAELAAIGGVHPVHLSREFRKHYDTTIGEFIRKRRIEHACHLLANSEKSLSEIALMCGFSDQSHFCAMFKSHTTLTPAKFRDMSARP